MAQISIKNPNGEYINFEVVDTASKQRIKQHEIDSLYYVEQSFLPLLVLSTKSILRTELSFMH